MHFGSIGKVGGELLSGAFHSEETLRLVHVNPVSVLLDIGAVVTLIKFLQNVCCEPQSGPWCRTFVVYKQLICCVVCFEAIFSSNTSGLF